MDINKPLSPKKTRLFLVSDKLQSSIVYANILNAIALDHSAITLTTLWLV